MANRFGRRLGLRIAALSAVLLTFAYAPGAPAFATSAWSVEPSSNPAGATSSYLDAASCSSPTSCTAVGYQYGPSEQNLAESSNGNPAPLSVSYVSLSSGPAAAVPS
jgi:hypothetical protein